MKQIIFLLLTTLSLSAQVKGVVLDSISGKPVAYVGVFTNQTYMNFSTDIKGRFKEKELQKTDTLWFFTTGYEIKKMLVKDVKKQVLLKPIKSIKPEQSKSNLKINHDSKVWIDVSGKIKKPGFISPSSTNLKAYYLNGIDSRNKKILLETLTVFALNMSKEKSVYKIRFFEADSLKEIGKELSKSIIETLKPYETGPLTYYKENVYKAKKTGIFKPIHVLEYQIAVNKNGLFIAFELMNIKENVEQSIELSKNQNFKVIKPIIEKSNITTKTYQFEKGKWILQENYDYFPMIKISIVQEEN